MPVFHAGKAQGFIGQHGKQPVGVFAGRNLHEVRGQLHHEMRLVGAVGAGQVFQPGHDPLRLGQNHAVMQRRDVGLEVAGRKLRPAFLFLLQQFPQVFRLIGLGLIPQERPQLGIGPPVEVQTGGLLPVALFIVQDDVVGLYRLGCDVPEVLGIVQLIEIAANDAPHLAGQLHSVGQHPVTGLLPVKLPCVVLRGALQVHITFPETMRPGRAGHPQKCLVLGLIAGSGPPDDLFVSVIIVPVISLEGFEKANDGRRGKGVFEKVMQAMDLLRRYKLPFGISTCYTSANYADISSEAFFDMMIEMGAMFVWFFHYMPVGNDAVPELLPSPDQRRTVYERVRAFRNTKPIFSMDFQNDAEYVGGCIAGGRSYLHINAAGDVEPCVFIHYSNVNIHECGLLDALKSPIFMAYHDGQPFNKNMLRPCPMLENPNILREMVKRTGAKSTDLQSPETVDHLCDKCELYAKHWQPVANELWASSRKGD